MDFISWKEFACDIKESFCEQRERQCFVDVTLVGDDGFQIQAHKVILSAASKFFDEVLKKSNHQSTIIYLKGVKSSELKCLVDYIYKGKACIVQDDLKSFLKTAHDLQVKGVHMDPEIKEDKYQTKDMGEVLNLNKGNVHPPGGLGTDALLKTDDLSQHDSQIEEKMEEYINAGSKSDNSESYVDEMLKSKEEIKMEEISTAPAIIKTSRIRKRELYTCQNCDYTANRPNRLKVHYEFVHLGIKYTCSQCEYEAKGAVYLKQHIQNIHEGIRYPCENCEYKGGSLKRLKIHIRSKHEGLRYPCDKCDHKATAKENLKIHQQNVHEGIRYPCNQCDYQAPDIYYLQKHILK